MKAIYSDETEYLFTQLRGIYDERVIALTGCSRTQLVSGAVMLPTDMTLQQLNSDPILTEINNEIIRLQQIAIPVKYVLEPKQ